MSALIPPPNNADVPLPQIPAAFPTLDDIGRSSTYIAALHWARIRPHPNPATNDEIGQAEQYRFDLLNFGAQTIASTMPRSCVAAGPMTNEIHQLHLAVNALIVSVNALIVSVNALTVSVNALIVSVNAHTVNVNDLTVSINALTVSVNALDVIVQNHISEQPIILANNRAGDREPLFDPTIHGQWAHLAPPNPTTCGALREFDDQACIASAQALGLPPLPADVDIVQRRRQIAVRIGVTID